MTQICAVTDDVILAIMQNCARLVSMNVGLCSHVTDQGIHHIAKYGKNIERLYLVSCKITDEGMYVDAAVISLLVLCGLSGFDNRRIYYDVMHCTNLVQVYLQNTA